MTYNYLIKPAVTAAGLKCVRADEITHSGPIEVPMYEQLLNADVVIADLSTSNKNAYYELGVRHALRPYTTIIICEDGIKTFPFDVNHVLIQQYLHMGEGIDYGEDTVALDKAVRVYAGPRREGTKAEAYLGIGKTAEADEASRDAYSFAPEGWMGESTKEQRSKLERLLADSPLKYVGDGEPTVDKR